MKTIGDIIKEKPKKIEKKKRGGITSLRADNCGQLLVFMGEDKTTPEEYALETKTPGAGRVAKKKRLNQRIKYWLGRTRKIEPGEIYRMMRQTKGSKNPQALFNYLLRKANETCQNSNQKCASAVIKPKPTSSDSTKEAPRLF